MAASKNCRGCVCRGSPIDNLPLVELIAKCGIADGLKRSEAGNVKSEAGIAESIENNIRGKVVKELGADPPLYGRIPELLEEIIALRKAHAIEYEECLKKIAEVANKVTIGACDQTPSTISTKETRALF